MSMQTTHNPRKRTFDLKRSMLALFLICTLIIPHCVNAVGLAEHLSETPAVSTEEPTGQVDNTANATKYHQDLLQPIIIKEDVSKRGEYEKHFLCDDGSYIAVSYPEPVHMQRGKQWVDAELPLSVVGSRIATDRKDAEFSLARTTTASEKDGLVRFNTGKHELRWFVKENNDESLESDIAATVETGIAVNSRNITVPNKRMTDDLIARKNVVQKRLDTSGAMPLRSDEAQLIDPVNDSIEDANRSFIQNVSFERAVVEYPGAMGDGATLRYILKSGSVKEEVVLKYRGDFASYTTQVNTDGLKSELQADNSILLKDEVGEVAATISSPYMFDDAGANSSAFTVKVTQNGNDLEITYTPDAAWLDATERIWPVVIDPEIATNSKDILTSKQIDNYVYDGQGNTIVSSTSNKLYVGYKSGKEYRTYWRLADLPGNAKGYTITGASFNIRFFDETSTMGSGGIELYRVTDSWESSKIKWTQKPGVSVDRLDVKNTLPASTTDGRWMVFNEVEVKKLVEKWYNGTADNYGFMLKYAKNEADYNAFYSADNGSGYFPYLEVKYQNSPPPKISNYNVPRSATKGKDVTLSATVTGKNISHGYWVIRKPNKDYLAHAIVYNPNKANSNYKCTYTFKADDFGNYTIDFATRDDNGVSWAEERTMTVSPVVSISSKNVSININETTTLSVVTQPLSGVVKSVDWISDNQGIATVSSSGVVTGKSTGITIITAEATATDNSVHNLTCTVTVNPPIRYGKYSLSIKTPTEPAYIKTALDAISAEFNIWPAAKESMYYGMTSEKRKQLLLDGYSHHLNDYVVEDSLTLAKQLTSGLKILFMKDAYSLYSHFLTSEGTSKNIDFKKMIAESSEAAELRKKDMNELLEAAEVYSTNLKIGESITFSSADQSSTSVKQPMNWFLAIHSYSTKSKCTVKKTDVNNYSAIVNYYLYDVFDWNRNDTENFTKSILGIKIDAGISQRDFWEIQHGGAGKGFKVTGENVLDLSWYKGQRMDSGVTINSEE